MSSDRINAFIRALELDPENHSLRLILAKHWKPRKRYTKL